MILSNQTDPSTVLDAAESSQILELLIAIRPDAKWILHSITKVPFFNYLWIDVELGCSQPVIPQQILRILNIKCLLSDRKNLPFNDNLCSFRALAYEIHGEELYLTETYKWFSQFIDKNRVEMKSFEGVNDTQTSIVEELNDAYKKLELKSYPQSTHSTVN